MRSRAIAIVAALLAATSLPAPRARAAQAWAPDAARVLYEGKCAVCHGVKGDGNGEAAYLLSPRPRDFTKGIYKFRSTPTGSLPTDEDLLRTITNGVPGTGMPEGKALTEEERRALVSHVKSFSPRFAEEDPEPPVVVPQAPVDLARLAKEGAAVYRKMQCFKCHGETGKGDGPAASTLKDDQKMPIRAYDFTRGGHMKGGSTARDVYRTFTTGLDGTPMPSYADSLPETQRWELVAFVQSLGTAGGAEEELPSGPVVATRVSQVVPLDPADLAWQEARPVRVGLKTLWSRDQALESVTVRAIHDGDQIEFLLEWTDPTPATSFLRTEDFRDAVAVEFPVQAPASAGATPFYGMGQGGAPVNIWHWKADWQKDVGLRLDVADVYPNMVSDAYPMYPREEGVYLTGQGVGNAFSASARSNPVEDLNAVGQGSLTAQSPSSQNVSGQGRWLDGRWQVVFQRPLASPDANDARFDGGPTWVAFAVWNGEQNDRNGQKAVSNWIRLEVETGVVGAAR